MNEKQIEAIAWLCAFLILAFVLICYSKFYKRVLMFDAKWPYGRISFQVIYNVFYGQIYLYPLVIFYTTEIFSFKIEKYFLFIFLTLLILAILFFEKMGLFLIKIMGIRGFVSKDNLYIIENKKRYLQSFFLTFYIFAFVINFMSVTICIFK